MGEAHELMGIAREVLASASEKELERLLKDFLPGSPFANKVYAVGGYVRDEILGLDPKDLDVVVEMRNGAENLARLIHGSFPIETSTPRQMGKGYPIWQIAFKADVTYRGEEYGTENTTVEFVDTQKESFPDSESRQRQVEYGTLEEDIARRDFTVNMLLKDLTTGEIKDLTGVSIQDLKAGVLRGHPGVSFDQILSDDPLRMLRLVRFQVKYGWDVPIGVLRAVRRNAKRIEIVSEERVRDELIRIAKLGKLGQAVKIMKATGLLQYVFPEIQGLKGVEHEYSKGSHQEGDVYRHTLMVLQNAKPGVESQFAALLHDVGKPKSQAVVEGLIRFIGHEKVGGEMAEAVMRRLRFENDVVLKVRTMVESHMRPHFLTREEGAGPKALRKFVREVGKEMVDAVLDLAEADQLGQLPPKNMIPDLRKEIDALMVSVQKAEELPLDGNDIKSVLGIKSGPAVGEAMKYLKDTKYEWELAGKEMTKQDAERLLMERFGTGV